MFEQVARERVLRIIVEDRRGATDRLRPEARAGTIGDGGVKGNAPYHGVRAPHVLGVFAPHERQRAGIGRLERRARLGTGGEGVVDLFVRHYGSSVVIGQPQLPNRHATCQSQLAETEWRSMSAT